MAEESDVTQYLTFVLDGEVFAVDVSRVREILEIPSITKVPQVPVFMRGVINLRGCVVPVIDLRLKFNMREAAQTVNTCIIVVEVNKFKGLYSLTILPVSTVLSFFTLTK